MAAMGAAGKRIDQTELDPGKTASLFLTSPGARLRAIETEGFPFARISSLAEVESWRKEVHRPVYHMHKWWAQRLGSVFRSILIGCFADASDDVYDLFHKPTRIRDAVVFDPFMGSGTTVGEALKLGTRAAGRDINPVAHFAVKNALEPHPIDEVKSVFRELERDLKPEVMQWYEAKMPDGSLATTLYYFWVKTLPCPKCSEQVDLFSSRIFSSHAYPKKHPESKATCPGCGAVNDVLHGQPEAKCHECGNVYDPARGTCDRSSAHCPCCSHSFKIAQTARYSKEPPAHRLYAKMVLTRKGEKVYLAADDHDRTLYAEAEKELQRRGLGWFPAVEIKDGYNTKQAINYNYRRWDQFFNARQLLCLGIMADRIRRLPHGPVRDLFASLFSGTLEFNNLFASFKGEGTGAVRHMFAHHILKPERTPLEANPWGTPKSSGSFSTLFQRRIMKGLEYRQDPTEIADGGKGKVSGISESLGHEAAGSWDEFAGGRSLYLSCGDSSATDIPDKSVDAVVTDPPFFDNVNYSELADFFHVWQRHILGLNGSDSTRSDREVQHGDPSTFGERLSAVWTECCRILKDDGIMVFSYHHSRPEGWDCVLASLIRGGFRITASHPVKAEMSVASPKTAAKEPIDLDALIVCRKRGEDEGVPEGFVEESEVVAVRQVERLLAAGRKLSRNDIRVVLMGQVLKALSPCRESEAMDALGAATGAIEDAIERVAKLRGQ